MALLGGKHHLAMSHLEKVRHRSPFPSQQSKVGGKGGAVHKKEGCGMKRLGTFSKLGKNHSIYVKFE